MEGYSLRQINKKGLGVSQGLFGDCNGPKIQSMVRAAGLEPARGEPQQILSLFFYYTSNYAPLLYRHIIHCFSIYYILSVDAPSTAEYSTLGFRKLPQWFRETRHEWIDHAKTNQAHC